jgi:hypothetical protein
MNLMRFLRKNMNKMLWVLVIFIAAAFGITGTMTDVFQTWWGTAPVGRVFGRAVYYGEFTSVLKRLERERRGAEETKVSDDEVWERIAQLEEAKRCHIEISQQELSEAILNDYRYLKLRDDILTTSKKKEEFDRRWAELWKLPEHVRKQRLESEPFDPNNYANLIRKYLGYTVGEYEEIARESLILNRLGVFVRSSAKMTTKKLYEEFIETDHKRQIEYLAIHSKSFKDKVDASDARLKEYYESNKKRYIEKDKIAFEYVMARFEGFKKDIPDPKEEELKEYYAKSRDKYLRHPERETGQPAKEDDYKPYEEVRVNVLERFREDKAKEVAQKTLKDLKAKLDKEEQLPFEKAQEIAKGFNLEAKETEPFELDEFPSKFEAEFGACREVITMFRRKDEIPALSIRTYSDPVECSYGLFLYRLSKLVSEHPSPFEKVKEEVKAAFINEEAARLAKQKTEEVAKEIKEQKEITRPLLLKYNTYSVVTDFFANTNREGKILSIVNDQGVIERAFSLKDIGEVSDPIDVQSMGDQIFYIVKYLARNDPTPKEFKDNRFNLIYGARGAESNRFSKEWGKDLTQRAKITPTKEKPRPISPSPPEEEEPGY